MNRLKWALLACLLSFGAVVGTAAVKSPGSVAATSANIIAAFTGSCTSGTFLRGDGACAAAGGGSPAFSSVTAGTNTAALLVGTGGTLGPTGTGAITATALPTTGLSGALQAAQFPALTGNVTTSAGSLATTIASSAVTLGMQANLAANSIECNNTGSPAAPIACTTAQAKTLLAIANTDVSGLGTLSTANAVSPPAIGGTTPAAGTFTALTSTTPAANLASGLTQAANTSGDGLTLIDSTVASTGNQQFSPRIRLTGQGWKTTATAASQPVDWIIENQPVQGAANPDTKFVISGQINGGGYAAMLTIQKSNSFVSVTNLQSTGLLVPTGALQSGGGAFTIASGTGACGTTSTLVGGRLAGHFTCTGTTGASTVTLTTPTTNAGNVCFGRDVTTPTVVTQTGAISTTAATLTLTSVTANDVIEFACPMSY